VTLKSREPFEALADPDTGELERAAEGSWYLPTEVKLVGERLLWKGPFERSVRTASRLLEDFVRLVDAPDETIEAYARHWGLIGVCGEGMPFSWHRRFDGCLPYGHTENGLPDNVLAFQALKLKQPWEPIDVWRFLARQLRGFLNAAAAFRDGGKAAPSDLQDMRGQGRLASAWEASQFHYRPSASPSRREQLLALRMFIHQSQRLTEIVPVYTMGSPPIVIHGTVSQPGGAVSGLYRALVMQACMAAAQSQGWALCSEGNHPYHRRTRARLGQHNYCPEHKKAGAAARSSAYRLRVRKGSEGS
jgi:hypothetical protein